MFVGLNFDLCLQATDFFQGFGSDVYFSMRFLYSSCVLFFVIQGILELSLDASTSQVLDDAFADELQEHLVDSVCHRVLKAGILYLPGPIG